MISFAVLASPESWYAADLKRAAEDRYRVVVVPFSQISATMGAMSSWESGGHDLGTFSAVLVRTMPPGSLEQVIFRMDALAQLQQSGTLVVNPPRALEAAIDKYLALEKLRAAGLLTPLTWVGQTAEQALVAWEHLGCDVVVKPLFGSEGRGIFRVSDGDLALRAFTTLERLGAVIYLQQFVQHEGLDLRLFVLAEQVWAMKRINGQDWRTNVSRGARTEAADVTDALREVAIRASNAIGTIVAGVDLIPGRDGRLYVIEVNAVPGWRALSRTLSVDIARKLLDFMALRCAGQTQA